MNEAENVALQVEVGLVVELNSRCLLEILDTIGARS